MALLKYKKKCDALKCVNSMILLYVLHGVKNAMVNHETIENYHVLRSYKTYVARMLSVLYYFRLSATSSDVMAYIQLIVAVNMAAYRQSISDEFFDNKAIHDYFGHCQVSELLTRFQSKYVTNEYYFQRSTIIDELVKQFYDNDQLQEAYKYEHLFTPENMTLSRLFEKQHVLFEKNNLVNFSLAGMQTSLNTYAAELSRLYYTHQWPFNVTKYMHFYSVVLQIAYTTVLYHAWLHIKLMQFTILDCLAGKVSTSTGCDYLDTYSSLIADPLEKAVDLLVIDENNLILPMMHLLELGIVGQQLNYFELKLRRVLLFCLKTIHVDNADTIDITLKRLKNLKKEKFIQLIEENSEALNKYVSDITIAIQPIDNFFFLKFISENVFAENSFRLYDSIKYTL
ncbi:uncharacterized protein LOC126844473 isoform X2 [Adelges cooleyi]|nr:uncharacterized protein LOC126844473 isoform X2 [Adelges cooleyi]